MSAHCCSGHLANTLSICFLEWIPQASSWMQHLGQWASLQDCVNVSELLPICPYRANFLPCDSANVLDLFALNSLKWNTTAVDPYSMDNFFFFSTDTNVMHNPANMVPDWFPAAEGWQVFLKGLTVQGRESHGESSLHWKSTCPRGDSERKHCPH